jgi:UbiD family decarboxylase
MPVVESDRVYHRNAPIFEHLDLGQPWTEIDYMMAMLYPEPFRLKPEDVGNFPVVPTIPALREKRSNE